MARKTKAQIRREQQEELKQWITIVILSALMLIGLLKTGVIGSFLYHLLRYLIGNVFWLILITVIILTFLNVMDHRRGEESENPVPFILIISAILLMSEYFHTSEIGIPALTYYIENTLAFFQANAESLSVGGGIAGAFLYALASMLFGRIGVVIVIVVLFIIASFMIVSLDVYKSVFKTVHDFLKKPEKEVEEEEEEPEVVEEKEPRNLWIMLDEHKKKKEEKKALVGSIAVDTNEVEPDSVSIMKKEEEPDKPFVRKLVNITADHQTEEISVVQIPGKTISDQNSVFINIDELKDTVGERAQEELAATADYSFEEIKDESIAEPVIDDYEEEEEIVTEPVPVQQAQPALQETETTAAIETKHTKEPYHIPSPRQVGQMLDPLVAKDANAENEIAAKEKGQLLISILRNFDIEAELIATHIGPSVTQFEIKPDIGVKVSKILGLADNIKMALSAKDVRIEAPIPGRNAVGIEIPNVKSTPVKLREIINEVPEKDKKQPLVFFVGKDLLGQPVTCRLDKMPHLLIAGATGSGKSVCMNSIITSLLLRTDPEDVKMLLIDPKKVEFTPYRKIPHLIGPVIDDPNKANNALKVVVQIMDERYNIFAAAGVRNIEVYNKKVMEQGGRRNPDGSPAPKKMPYIVVIIDELADLMAVAGKDVEQSIQRITQLARAAGIHLIVATQRPSVDVITGIIKANIPSRIAFAVSSGTDSRTILDHVGAERLLGNGDMLYMPIGASSSIRVQGVFITDDEVKKITDYVSAKGTPMFDDKFILLEGVNDASGAGGVMEISDDPLFMEVKDFVVETQKASTSLLQRRFGIGYNRAARMIDALEEKGIIGPAQGSKPREVFLKSDHSANRTESGDIID